MRTAAALAGLLGGLAWIAAYVLGGLDRGSAADVLTWAGLALLAFATLAAGAALVSRSATWLRAIVAVCFALLVGSVLQVLGQGVDDQVVRAGAGAVAAIIALVVIARPSAAPVHESTETARGRRPGGAHAR